MGRRAFLNATGIKVADWSGKFWARWSDLVREAGFEPNAFNVSLDENPVLEKLTGLISDLGRFPTGPEMRLRRSSESSFPCHAIERLGTRGQLIEKCIAFCKDKAELSHVEAILVARTSPPEIVEEESPETGGADGFVYLMRCGKFHKIGLTYSVGRREYEIRLQMPDPLETIHTIKTDDPIGIENYWHLRFAERRRNGEWFQLTASDVRAFKRRKFM